MSFYLTGLFAKAKEAIKAFAPKLNIHAYKRIDYADPLRLYSSRLTLHPSHWEEGFCYAVLESRLLGALPIATRVGGIPEVDAGTIAEQFLIDLFDDVPLQLSEHITNVISGGSPSQEEVTTSFRRKFGSNYQSLVKDRLIATFRRFL